MSDNENETPEQPVEAEPEAEAEAEAPAAAVPAEALDQTTALGRVMKTALAHDGLARGIHEVCRALEKEQAQLCILADDCDQADYKKLIESLCNEKGVDLIAVETNKKLGELAALCKLNAEGEPSKVVGCSSACITDYGEDTEALKVLKGMLKSKS